MSDLSVMFKTVSAGCNLNCTYCYYHQPRENNCYRQIETSVIEAFVPQYMDYIADNKRAILGWQGGEPTLAGLDFFRWLMKIEAHHAHRGTIISNSLQTNGTLISDEWADFLSQYRFLVGVSLDGPEIIHDSQRRDKVSKGSFHRVIKGIDSLRRHSIEPNILCVVGPHNVTRVSEVMKFFRDEDFSYLQFIPAMGFQATEPEIPPHYLINPEEYGDFLVTLFDEWYNNGLPRISVRYFDNLLQSYIGIPTESCIHSDTCNSSITVEYNGDVYPCDFYINPKWKLGNILQKSLKEMVGSPERKAFTQRKYPLPSKCQECKWKRICQGGCVRNRRSHKDGSQKSEYFCTSYSSLFNHADKMLSELSTRVHNYQIYLQNINTMSTEHIPIPGRNELCPCGSGRKHKLCCGFSNLSNSYLFLPTSNSQVR